MDAFVLTIDSLAYGGDGVGRFEGKVCFVPFTAPGDVVRVRVRRDHARFTRAEAVEILQPSPLRTTPRCAHFGTCGGCQWQHLRYDAQLEAKAEIVRSALARVGGTAAGVEPVMSSAEEYGYRRRARLHSGGGRMGYFARGSHDIVDIEACPVLEPALEAALERARSVCPEGAVDIETGLEGVGIRCRKGAGRARGAFRQANRSINTVLRSTVRDLLRARVPAGGRVLDLYCGDGNLTMDVAAAGMQVDGYDAGAAVVRRARRRAEERGLTQARYHREQVEQTLLSVPGRSWDAVVVDPPRTGLGDLAEALGSMGVPVVVYVSCSPPTLARDIGTLAAWGYSLSHVQPLDMFPQTFHVETVAVLELRTTPGSR